MKTTRDLYHPDVQCGVFRLEYSFEEHSGCLHIPEFHATDMRGTINLFQRIDPEVRKITVMAEGKEDIRYLLLGEKWVSQDNSRRMRKIRRSLGEG